MKRTPCEYVIWNGLPVIRKEIAETMITNFGLNQKEAAEKLGITPAAVCQYRAKKRGHITIDDPDLQKEITLSTQRILNEPDSDLIKETCRLCRLFIGKGIIPGACDTCPSDD